MTIDGTTYTVEQQPPYILNMSAVGYSTFYDAAARLLPEGLTAYTARGISDGHVSLTPVSESVIPAKTGLS